MQGIRGASSHTGTRTMNVLVSAVRLVARVCDTCMVMIDMRAAAERDLTCPHCGRVRRLSDQPIRIMLEGTWFMAPGDDELRPDGCVSCGWTPGEGPEQSGKRA
jgi:predicted RNA-binding Zn-ribbon protein involved in translation (DUF1610 family)